MSKEKDTNFFIKLWHTVDSIVAKAGFFRTLLICGVTLIIVFCGYIAMHPEKVFDEFIRYQSLKHDERVEKRLSKSPIIESLLVSLQCETNAHRCWVVEAHNGKENLTGLPFLFGQMTYQVCEDSVFNSAQDFQDFSLDRFPLVPKLIKDGYWSGTSQQLMEIDRALALKILVNETKSLCIITLYGRTSAIGWLGVSFVTEEGYNMVEIEGIVRRYSYEVARNIDATKI